MVCGHGRNRGNGSCRKNKIRRILDLEKDTCPNREQRANGTNVYYGKASELLQDAKNGNVRIPDRKFQQSGGCVLNFYLSNRVTTIRDSVTIFNAPVGCSAGTLGYRELYRGIPESLGRTNEYNNAWLTTNLQQDDVVYGVTTIEGAPDSAQAEVYRELVRKVIDNKNKFLPTPFDNDDLSDWASGWINQLLLNQKTEIDNVPEGSSGI